MKSILCFSRRRKNGHLQWMVPKVPHYDVFKFDPNLSVLGFNFSANLSLG